MLCAVLLVKMAYNLTTLLGFINDHYHLFFLCMCVCVGGVSLARGCYISTIICYKVSHYTVRCHSLCLHWSCSWQTKARFCLPCLDHPEYSLDRVYAQVKYCVVCMFLKGISQQHYTRSHWDYKSTESVYHIKLKYRYKYCMFVEIFLNVGVPTSGAASSPIVSITLPVQCNIEQQLILWYPDPEIKAYQEHY